MKIYTQLNFGGDCEDAFRFYEKHLGGKIMMMLKAGKPTYRWRRRSMRRASASSVTGSACPGRSFTSVPGRRSIAAALVALTAGATAHGQGRGAALTSPPRARVIAAAREVMKAARYATFVTLGERGEPQARIVDPGVPESSMTIWVATNPLTRKVIELKRDPRVTLLYFNAAAGEYVTVHGVATVVTDSAAKVRHWKSDWAPFYEKGPRGDDYLLIRVQPSRLEVVSPGRGIVSDPKTWRPVVVDLP